MSAAAIGTPRLNLGPVVSRRLPFRAELTCLACGRPVVIALGQIAATFRIGREVVGIACDDCLAPESRAQLLEMRARMTAPDLPEDE